VIRFGLALVTAAVLVVACVVSMRRISSAVHLRRFRLLLQTGLAVFLIALSVLFALRPGLERGSFPLTQALLLAAALAAGAAAFSLPPRGSKTPGQSFDAFAVDALTGIASHRAFQDRLAHECERAYRFGDTFVLLMLDLDDFHPINNQYGHRAGDKLLVDLARQLRVQLREIDMVARFGGDQFAMILPHTYEKGGTEVAERLRQKVAGWVFLASGNVEIHLTASVGLCVYPRDGASAPDLVEATHKALKFAKAMGGNQVQSSRDLPSKEAPDNVVSFTRSGRGAIVRSLAAAVDLRDGYTREHSQLVSELSVAVAKNLALPKEEVERIGEGALLHDVGKIGVPDAILAKAGGLSPQEWKSIRRHPVLGRQIIEQAPELMDVVPLVLHHQEHYDGSGYPQRLRGDDIPLGARIIAAADAYHAIRSDRPYRSGRTHEEATLELRRCSGGQFDPAVVEALVAALDGDPSLQGMRPLDSGLLAATGPAAAHA
jgi:diguanylate cyclase (GGDEF)-like protein